MSKVVKRHTRWTTANWCHCGVDLKSNCVTICPNCGCNGRGFTEQGRFEWEETIHSLPVRILRAFVGLERPTTPKRWVKWKGCADPQSEK
jgi:hypothetical protein